MSGAGRLLVVQKTGWGKSFVYFTATKLLREAGMGPALLVSPLLALMRNQITAAERMGVTAETINSDNLARWREVEEAVRRDEVDILLISPERLANERFRDEVLSEVAGRLGLLVIDEAHCISDWGHDFRPHYRLIERILRTLPPNLRLLATTATANDRVKDGPGGDPRAEPEDLPRRPRASHAGASDHTPAQPGRTAGMAGGTATGASRQRDCLHTHGSRRRASGRLASKPWNPRRGVYRCDRGASGFGAGIARQQGESACGHDRVGNGLRQA